MRAQEGIKENAGEKEWGSDDERELEELVAISKQLDAKIREEFNATRGRSAASFFCSVPRG